MTDSKLVDIAAESRGETERAFRLYDGARTEWVPKSQVEDNGDGTYTMPEWLAKDRSARKAAAGRGANRHLNFEVKNELA